MGNNRSSHTDYTSLLILVPIIRQHDECITNELTSLIFCMPACIMSLFDRVINV